MSYSDSNVIEVLEETNKYALSQVKLAKLLSEGIFQLTLARKNKYSSNICSIDDIRFELDANSYVELTSLNKNELIDTSSYILTEMKNVDRKIALQEALALVSGLPPKELVKSQKHFVQALNEVIDLSNSIKRIQKTLK